MVNVIIDTYNQDDMGSLLLHPDEGQVAFGSGKEQWAFTLTKFARIYAKKFGIDRNKMMKKLWGDNFFDPADKKWKGDNFNDAGKPIRRAFAQFIMDPICKLANACMDNDVELMNKMLVSLELTLSQEDKELKGKHLLKAVMSKWLNAADTILEMMVVHLPSPRKAQAYRTAYLYEGPQDDVIAQSMRACNPKGPLMMFVSKMVPTPDKGRFVAFGRVFSGTIATSQKVRILGPNFVYGKKDDVHEKTLQRTLIMQGRTTEYVPDVPCGNTVGLVGVDQFIMKTATITDHPDAHTIRMMKYSVSPVVRVAVAVKNAGDLPKLVDGLKKLSKSDPLVVCTTDESTGQHVIAGCGELHIEICLKDLEEDYAGCPIIKSEPVVTYKETVTEESSVICMSKSANKHNRIYGKAEPLAEGLPEEIEEGKVGPKDDPKERSKYLADKYEWDRAEAGIKLWSFGPENAGPNVVVDQTKGIQYVTDIKDSIDSAWQWASKEAPMTEEGMRGVRINLLDCVLHADTIHRGAGQILPAARRLFYACLLSAEPRLQEPIFTAEITAPQDAMGGVYNCLNQRRGIINEEEQIPGTPMAVVRTTLNLLPSFTNLCYFFRLRLSSPSLNPSVSPLILEDSLKARPSLSASSITGLPSTPHPSRKAPSLSKSSTPSERERVSRKVFPSSPTTSTSYDQSTYISRILSSNTSYLCIRRIYSSKSILPLTHFNLFDGLVGTQPLIHSCSQSIDRSAYHQSSVEDGSPPCVQITRISSNN